MIVTRTEEVNELIDVVEKRFSNGVNDVYEYHSPTHWGSHGICRINNRGQLSWSAGGTESGYTHIAIAQVMSTAFFMASERLMKMKEEKEAVAIS